MSEAKVFAPGTLTVALTHDAVTLACGAANVQYVRSVGVFFDNETKSVKAYVEFYRSHDKETSLKIEEAMRMVRTLGWVEVKN